jgi:NADPH:quinone reductase-like Zn-dependent oxidoreductase
MKVARIHQHGGPEVLVYEDAPEPQIKANEILLRVAPARSIIWTFSCAAAFPA